MKSVLTWGKPTIEVAPFVDGSPGTDWITFPTIKKGTANLTATKGEETEALGEGDELVDTRIAPNKYLFVCDVFVKNGEERPVEDVDGVIAGYYSWRLTPEDDTLEGHQMEKCKMSVQEAWTSAEGTMLHYEVKGMSPDDGSRTLKPYTKDATP